MVEIEFRRQKLEVACVAATFFVYFLTMASTAGRGIMNNEVAGSIPTVTSIKA